MGRHAQDVPAHLYPNQDHDPTCHVISEGLLHPMTRKNQRSRHALAPRYTSKRGMETPIQPRLSERSLQMANSSATRELDVQREPRRAITTAVGNTVTFQTEWHLRMTPRAQYHEPRDSRR